MSAPSALYKSPTADAVHNISPSSTLPALSSDPTTNDRVAYLAALQSSVKDLQAEVNTFLTQKMEEDKVIVGQIGAKVDDAKEEENYGEEIVEDD
ncbi:hypothetical protein B0J11DRAFT_442840 [Dendryphion nanum]|uniref:EKC/KEOPS complex subunit GON7 n=1 Tax=Dendryphion nanum TaxID=256645 RepID=A0A9P9IEN6_9PLEO|nr:hypothetical protein B0J11DRAFT_442840 [Dendryphion nanum]